MAELEDTRRTDKPKGVMDMPWWGWIAVAVGILMVFGLMIWTIWRRQRTEALRGQFGPEYDRAVRETGKRRRAESELEARRRRREQLVIRPLTPAARQRYVQAWAATQSRFVDSPSGSIHEADGLVLSVMQDQGYPMENFEQRAADVSVDHPKVVENYRAAHAISLADSHGRASTEDLRQAMVQYRALFEDLLTEDSMAQSREAR